MCQADDRFASLEQQAAEFAFQRLDCAGQRWLRDTAAARGPVKLFSSHSARK
jgi:hypothetical protein